jgi:hypothetical protein
MPYEEGMRRLPDDYAARSTVTVSPRRSRALIARCRSRASCRGFHTRNQRQKTYLLFSGTKQTLYTGSGMARLFTPAISCRTSFLVPLIPQKDVSLGTSCRCESVTICPHSEEACTTLVTPLCPWLSSTDPFGQKTHAALSVVICPQHHRIMAIGSCYRRPNAALRHSLMRDITASGR